MATDRGSSRAAASKLTLSGIIVSRIVVSPLQMLTSGDNVLVTPHGRVVDSLLQGTREERDALGTTSEPHLLTQIIATLATDPTRTTWDANFKSYTIAFCESCDLVADSDDDSRRLMAETEACSFSATDISIATLLIVAYI